MGKKYFLNMTILCLLAGLVGCAGPEGPMGPAGPTGATGPPGPGDQTVYSFDLSPAEASDSFVLSCPAVDVDDSAYLCSTVCIYLSYDLLEYISLPCDVEEDAHTITSFFYVIKEDEVELHYSNSAATVPAAFTIFVTVINP